MILLNDSVLARKINQLENDLRQSDVVARLGGDEFAVAAKRSDMSPALERLKKRVDQANSQAKRPYRISYSVGQVTERPSTDHPFDELLDRADALMYKEKQKKKYTQNEMTA